MTPVLEVKNLRKQYKDVVAVDGISFSVGAGEIVGLLGPNGAGKTTTIDMILGIVTPTSGDIRVFGKEFVDNREEILRQMNFAAVYAHFPGNLSVWQNLYIFALLYDIPHAKKRVDELMDEFHLHPFAKTRVGFLSSGEQSRLHLAKALLNNPRLILMDEPTASIDPEASQSIRERIKTYAKNNDAGVLWTSHDMREIEQVCDRVLFISHGKILLEGSPHDLPAQHGKKDLEELFIAIAREPLSFHNSQS